MEISNISINKNIVDIIDNADIRKVEKNISNKSQSIEAKDIDLRNKKIEEIKLKIKNGSYNVDLKEVAKKVIGW